MELGRGAKTIVLLAAAVVVAAGIKLAAALLVPLLLAGFVAMVTSPLVLWLQRKRIPPMVAVPLAVLLDVAVLGLLGTLVGTSLSLFYKRLPTYQDEITTVVANAAEFLAAYGVSQQELMKAVDPGSLMGMVAVLFQSITGLVSNAVLVLLIVVFMLLEATGLRVKMSQVLGDEGGELGRMRKATRQVTRYLVFKTLTSAVTGVLVGIWLAICGVDLPVLWGLLVFMLNFIPTLGSVIAAVPIGALTLIQLGPGTAVGVLTGYTVINATLGSFIEPRIFGRAVGLSPMVVFISMILWGWLLGPVGALLSVPLTLILKIYLANTEDLRWAATMLSPASDLDGAGPSAVPPRVDHDRSSITPPPARAGPDEGAGDDPGRAQAEARDTDAEDVPHGNAAQ